MANEQVKIVLGSMDIPIDEVEVPDLWHLAMWLGDGATGRQANKKLTANEYLSCKEAVLKCWYQAHAMKQALTKIQMEINKKGG